jgi:hypothetical protein
MMCMCVYALYCINVMYLCDVYIVLCVFYRIVFYFIVFYCRCEDREMADEIGSYSAEHSHNALQNVSRTAGERRGGVRSERGYLLLLLLLQLTDYNYM